MPVPRRASSSAEAFDLGPALAWFPVVGGAVGGLAGAVRIVFDHLLGRGPSTVLAMAALVLVTGALHQDALADTFDGLGVRGDRARRLSVMRDSTLGAFGVLALVVWALLLFTSLEPLTRGHALRALIAAGATGRLAAILHGLILAPARQEGLGVGLRVTGRAAAAAAVLAVVIALAAMGPLRALLALGVAAAGAAVVTAVARSAVGGSTGDTLGAAVAITEVGVCLALLASWR